MKPKRHIVRSRYLATLAAAGLIVGTGCVQEVLIRTDAGAVAEVQNALVVEATLTDQVRTQEVILSRVADFTRDSIIEFDIQDPNTYLFPGQELEPRPVLYETGARVSVLDDTGQTYDFVEGDPGRYFSSNPFGVAVGRAYQLQVVLRNGERISSEFEAISGSAELEKLQPRRLTDPVLGDGIGFFADSRSTSEGAAYLRYDFEETFKVIAPLWVPEDIKLTYYDPCADPVEYTLEVYPREREEQVCYRSLASDDIALASTEGLSGEQVRDFRVHFIPRSSFKIAHRYSILVKQHTGSLGSYLFYDRLRNFSQEGNVFAQVQPGFLQGNLRAEGGSSLVVIGYFSVDTVKEQRLFLNFTDYFPGEPEPPYAVPCALLSSPDSHDTRCPLVPVDKDDGTGGSGGCPLSIIELLDLGDIIRFYGYFDSFNASLSPDEVLGNCPGSYVYTPRICGDCTVLGSNVPPDFWTEE